MSVVSDALPLLLRGAWVTIQLTVLGAALALVLALTAGLMNAAASRALRAVGRVYVEFFRGTATLVLMYWLFYALPLMGFRLAAMFAGVLALGLNVGAYGAEVVRGAIKAVPAVQVEAAVALNMTRAQRMRLVILPQSLAMMLPSFGNLLIELLKGTAVVSLISLTDLTFRAQQVRGATGETAVAFGLALVMYFVIAQVLTFGIRMAERRANAMLGRAPARNPMTAAAVRAVTR
ncbi:ectoine/hydroxyectoine ABC transporter permease subunit EhuC [Actinomadura sp. HBU206391]|uniref:ectoine/hydroxyectoine ABC transporter permease subunit EhuC n=1 Tax=Actinomadura sp. HBU206391 TaxID=2731692 RepID=UPI0016504EE9|nr:ectoine/hydroxyectoine ABC transporter permease subunit EhuC [Actinomadura sp. HBU206391]MBC6460496.1 ectoine/hydroxyectoine ABC transporter permease subunit EhuC [Actinomadura sp. HBU206391]